MTSKKSAVENDPDDPDEPLPAYRPPSPTPSYRTVETRVAEPTTRARTGITGRLSGIFSSRATRRPVPAAAPPPQITHLGPQPEPKWMGPDDEKDARANVGETLVVRARRSIEENNYWRFRSLMREKFDVDTTFEDGSRLLHIAAEFGRVSMVQDLLRCKPDVIITNGRWYTPVHLAAKNGHMQVLEMLLTAEAEPKSKKPRLRTSLELAAEWGYEDVVRVIAQLENHAVGEGIYRQRPWIVRWAADCAAENGHRAITALLNDLAGTIPDPYAVRYELNILNHAITNGWPEVVAQALARCRRDNLLHNPGDPSWIQLLLSAAKIGNPDIVAQLLRAGIPATVGTPSRHGYLWPLNSAANGGHLEAVRLLLDYGADPNAQDKDNNTALYLAMLYPPFTPVVKLLVERGADVHIIGQRGYTACDLAKQIDDAEVHKLFSACIEKCPRKGKLLPPWKEALGLEA
ncbi:ankyrin repeat-containing domain protein [Aspergillus pseudoustus]|uniref:Ankyrin repeat-containing domain protein n=1 Tax=Aspergillus pseudoustus TaxID=1810923 RepID=A0ABR4KZ79_9EURO